MGRYLRAALVAGAATAVAVLGSGSAASAHVTVHADEAKPGGDATVVFVVPDESDTASTTKVEVAIPTDKPIASVLTTPVPGWTAAVDTTKLSTPVKTDDGEVSEVVSKITWTTNSADAALKPGQFGQFTVSVGPLPDTDRIVFKTLQTYSDGNVVRWIDEQTPGGAEPEHPAPVLTLAKGDPTPAAPASVKSDSTARALGTIGLILGALALVLAVFAVLRRRPAVPPAT